LLYAWVIAEDRLRTAEAEQQKFNGRLPLPYLIHTKDGLQNSPYVDIIDRTMDKLIRLSDRLGFSPDARPRVQVDQAPGGEDAADTWGELRRFPVIDGGKAR
jgi:phage terminase small subunit